jgi:hypothetical protein
MYVRVPLCNEPRPDAGAPLTDFTKLRRIARTALPSIPEATAIREHCWGARVMRSFRTRATIALAVCCVVSACGGGGGGGGGGGTRAIRTAESNLTGSIPETVHAQPRGAVMHDDAVFVINGATLTDRLGNDVAM